MAMTLADFFDGLAGKDYDATQLKRAQLKSVQAGLADAKAQREGEMGAALTLADIAKRGAGNAEQQGGLIGLGGTPDMLPSVAQTFGAPRGGQSQAMGVQDFATEAQRLQRMVADNEVAIAELTKSGDVYQIRAADKLKKDNIAIMEKLPELRAKELDTKLKSEMANYNRLSGIVDDESLNLAMAQASPEERAAIAKNYGIMPNFGTGLYSFNTPEVQTLIKGAKQLSLTQVQRLEEQKRRDDVLNQERIRQQTEARDAEARRANKANEGMRREELDFKKSKAGELDGLPKPAPGYRWNEDRTAQELIPGGPAFNKMKGVAMKEAKLLDSVKTEYGNIVEVIDQLIGNQEKKIPPHPGLGSGTGITGVGVRRIPGTDARDLQAKLATLEAKTAFGSLQKMRAESPTGGALGPVAVKELELLKNSIAPIDPTVSKEDFIKNLRDLRDKVKGSEKRLFDTYQEAYAPVLGVRTSAAPKAQAASDEDLINKYLPKEPNK